MNMLIAVYIVSFTLYLLYLSLKKLNKTDAALALSQPFEADYLQATPESIYISRI